MTDDEQLRALARDMGLADDDPKVLEDLRTLKQADPNAGEATQRQAPPVVRPPGWYPNPNAFGQRYWGGRGWTGRYADNKGNVFDVPPPDPKRKTREGDSLIGIGYVLAFLVPIIGFVIGIVLLVPRQNREGWGVLVTSVLVSIFWILVLNGVA